MILKHVLLLQKQVPNFFLIFFSADLFTLYSHLIINPLIYTELTRVYKKITYHMKTIISVTKNKYFFWGHEKFDVSKLINMIEIDFNIYKLFIYLLFYLYIYLPDPQESDGSTNT